MLLRDRTYRDVPRVAGDKFDHGIIRTVARLAARLGGSFPDALVLIAAHDPVLVEHFHRELATGARRAHEVLNRCLARERRAVEVAQNHHRMERRIMSEKDDPIGEAFRLSEGLGGAYCLFEVLGDHAEFREAFKAADVKAGNRTPVERVLTKAAAIMLSFDPKFGVKAPSIYECLRRALDEDLALAHEVRLQTTANLRPSRDTRRILQERAVERSRSMMMGTESEPAPRTAADEVVARAAVKVAKDPTLTPHAAMTQVLNEDGALAEHYRLSVTPRARLR